MHRRLVLALAGTAVLVAPARARADATDPVQLAYTRGPGAESCPDEPGLRDAVAAKLGYNPFAPTAARTLRVGIVRRRSGLTATVDLIEHGAVAGTRVVSSPAGGCTELAASVALTMSIAIDPLSATVQERPAPAPPAPVASSSSPPSSSAPSSSAPSTPVPSRLAPAPTQPAPSRPLEPAPSTRPLGVPLVVSISLGPLVGFGVAPAPLVGGGALQLRVRRAALSLATELRVDVPGGADVGGGKHVASSVVLGSVIPCVHFGLFLGCAHGALGALSGKAEGVPVTSPQTTIFAAAGARVAAEWSFSTLFAVRASADLLATLTPTTLRIAGVPEWQTFPISGALGLALVGTIPVPSRLAPAPTQPAPSRPLEPAPSTRPLGVPLVVSISLGPLVGFGIAPAPLVGGGALQLRVRRAALSLAAELRADVPGGADVGGGKHVASSVVLGSVIPCVHFGLFLGCAHGALGALSGKAEGVPVTSPQTTIFAAAGARVAAEWSVSTLFAVRASADLLATLTPTTLRIAGVPEWQTFPISGALGLALVGTIP